MFKLSPKRKRFIQQVIPFGLIWMVSAIISSFIEKGILGEATHYPSTGNPYDFTTNFLVSSSFALIIGMIVGAIEISYLHKLFLKQSFTRKLVLKTLIYIGILITFLLFTSWLNNANRIGRELSDPQVEESVGIFFFSFAFVSVSIYIAVAIIISLFYAEVSDNLGQGVLVNFFTGKYHHPREEDRIFMFLDMKSSTTIAEELGHVQYFEYLKEYYAAISDPIVEYGGEVYQYVGDEIIVSWGLKEGLYQNNCLNCFYAMSEKLKLEAEQFESKYGIVPDFKAGIHHGQVTVGEIGEIKTHIMFSGDVLNTTARIQGLCNQYQEDLLISESIVEKLSAPIRFRFSPLGEVDLRGRNELIVLYAVQKL